MTPVQVAVRPDGSPDPRWHVRDEQTRYSALPACGLPPLDFRVAREIHMSCLSATMFLPAAESAATLEVPDENWQGWEWQSGDAMLIEIDRDPMLPRLSRLIVPDDGWCQTTIAGMAMGVWHIAPDGSGSRDNRYAAEVFGFVDETKRFWAQVRSATAEGCEILLAALGTIRRTSADW